MFFYDKEGFCFKSDIWSYGIVLWELLTFDVPYRYIEQPRLLYMIARYNHTLFIPDGVPDLFVELFTGECESFGNELLFYIMIKK